MIDIKQLREDPDAYRQAAKVKRMAVDIDGLLELDGQVLDAQRELQEIKTAQNRAGKDIARLQGEEKQAAIEQMGKLKSRVKELDDRLVELQPRLDEQLLLVPQLPAPEVPIGQTDADNVEVRREGELPAFDFQPRDHVELGEALDIIDLPRGVKLAGARNFILKGAGAMLHQAVLRLAMDGMVAKGYEPMVVPMLVNDEIMEGTGYFPVGRDQAYLCERDGQALAGTAEVPVTAYYKDEILSAEDLPKKFVAQSTCFRREAGAAGKDTHGLYRIHFFDKVEQVILCQADDAVSQAHHEEIIANAEEVLRKLELPYRLIEVCTGDMGQGKVRMYDIETWMPSRDSYGETHSASRFGDFQARRLNIRYRDADGKPQFCHTLNNTVIASPRILIALLEVHQQSDGSIRIPPALQPYMGAMKAIKAPPSEA
jgi:seryl-tRNA synthetase